MIDKSPGLFEVFLLFRRDPWRKLETRSHCSWMQSLALRSSFPLTRVKYILMSWMYRQHTQTWQPWLGRYNTSWLPWLDDIILPG